MKHRASLAAQLDWRRILEIEVIRCTVDDVVTSPELPALVVEYASESANHEIGPINPQFDTYRAMEAGGFLTAFSARLDGNLIGFLFLLTPVLPHFGRRTGIAESYFVASAHRKTGAGDQLRRVAEDYARSVGCSGLMFSAPTGGVLEKVLPGVGYRAAASTFFKAFK